MEEMDWQVQKETNEINVIKEIQEFKEKEALMEEMD